MFGKIAQISLDNDKFYMIFIKMFRYHILSSSLYPWYKTRLLYEFICIDGATTYLKNFNQDVFIYLKY